MLLLRRNRESIVDYDVPNPHYPGTCFSLNWYVFGLDADVSMPMSMAPLILEIFRKTLIKHADGDQIAMQLVSGHEVSGAATDKSHLVIIPLGRVGTATADGHFVGVGLVLPKGLSYEQRLAIRHTVERAMGNRMCISLYDRYLHLDLHLFEWSKVYGFLNPEKYSGPAKTWATVLPFVPDKMLKRHEKISTWQEKQLVTACLRIGLPAPQLIAAGNNSAIVGAPVASVVTPLLRRSDRVPRFHFHCTFSFPWDISGPVVIGAGRFRGYGVCLPVDPSWQVVDEADIG